MSNLSTCISRCAALALASITAAASAADPATPAGNSALPAVVVEAEGAAPSASKPVAQGFAGTIRAARESLRQRVTRMYPPDGSTIYRYNGTVLDQLVLTRDADGTAHVMCTDATHGHGAAPARGASDVR